MAHPLQFCGNVANNTHTKERVMKKTVAISGLKVRSAVKAGGLTMTNHNRAGLKASR